MSDLFKAPNNIPMLKFPYHPKRRTPHSKKVYVTFNPSELKNLPYDMCSYKMRLATAHIWRTCKLLETKHGEEPFSIGRKEFYEMCIPEKDRLFCSHTIFGKTVNAALLYKAGKTIRKRSGGRDPETGRNKSILIDTTYFFASIYDPLYAMEYMIALWLPYFTERQGEGSVFQADDLDRWLEFILNEPPEELMEDLLLVKEEEYDEEEIVGKKPVSFEEREEALRVKRKLRKEYRKWLDGFSDPPTADEKAAFFRRNKPGYDKNGYKL